jgi:hypothetical protein
MVVRTNKCVRQPPGNEAADEGSVIQRTDVNPVWVRFDTRIHKSITHTRDARIDGRCRERIGNKMKTAATELE